MLRTTAPRPSAACPFPVAGRRAGARRPSLLEGRRSPNPMSSLPTTEPASCAGGACAALAALAGPDGSGALVLIRATISPTFTTWPFTRVISTTTPSTGEGMSVTTLSVSTTASGFPRLHALPRGHLQLDDGAFGETLPDVGEMELEQPVSRLIAHHLSRFRHHLLRADQVVPLPARHGVDHVGARKARRRRLQADRRPAP